MTLKSSLLFFLVLVGSVHLSAQDPVVMRINGKDVLRSEFEYSFNKNNNGDIRSLKAIMDYVPMFVDYKLKVAAAEDAGYDTLTTFRNEFSMYRNQQIRPLIADQGFAEQKAIEYYNNLYAETEPDGMVKVAHILLRVGVNEPESKRIAIKNRADSIYQTLLRGADFAQMARRYSQDAASAANGGELPWFGKYRTLKEFEEVAFAMTNGQLSRVFVTPLGFHVVKKIGFKHLEPYSQLRSSLIAKMLASGLADQGADARINQIVQASGYTLTAEQVMQQLTDEQTARDINLKYLIQEYREGLLLFEASQREVWDKAAADEGALDHFYRLHESEYLWVSPRFKGLVIHCADKDVAKRVREALKKQPEDLWENIIETQINTPSEKLCRVEKGIFRQGDHQSVDNAIFKQKNAELKKYETYPEVVLEGRKIAQPESYRDVKTQLVKDYQKVLEEGWIDALRKKYPVEIKQEALKTVNNH